MDWTIKPFSKQSAVSGAAFTIGESVLSILYKDQAGELQRMDIRQEEIEAVSFPPNILGKWERMVKYAHATQIKENKREYAASIEEVFISLFAEELPMDQDKEILKQILALWLERKKIIKRMATQIPGFLNYIHIKTKNVYAVSQDTFPKERLSIIVEQLKNILSHNKSN